MAFYSLRNFNSINLTFTQKLNHYTPKTFSPPQSHFHNKSLKTHKPSILPKHQQTFRRHKCTPDPNEFYE